MNNRLSLRHRSYTAPIAQKTLRVLELIISAPENPGVSRIAADLSLAKSTTHGILAALEESGWVLRDPVTRKYTCGHALIELASSAKVRIPLIEVARPIGQQLAAEVDQDVFLGMFTPSHIMILEQFESSKRLRVATKPGTMLSIFAGAAGKIFLAHFDEDFVATLVRSSTLPRFTPASMTDPELYLAELARVRGQGFAIDMEEYIPDVRALAVPICHGTGGRRRIVAGLWVVGLSSELHIEKMETAAQRTVVAGREISRELSRLT